MEEKADAEAARAKLAADEGSAKQEESDVQQQRLTRKEGEEARQNRVNAKKQDMQAERVRIATSKKRGGLDAKQLKTEGFDAEQLSAAGFSGHELRGAGFSYKELKAAGIDITQLRAEEIALEKSK